MLTFLDFVLLIILVVCVVILLFLMTGIIYNQDGYVSFINKGKKLYKIEERKFSYHFPILFRKVGYYPTKPHKYKVDGKEVMLYVKDTMLLYKNKINLRKLLKQNKNLEANLKKYKIIIVK